MSDITRRGFVQNSAAAAAGVTFVCALLADEAQAHSVADGSGDEKPVLAYVHSTRTGEISVLAGDREIRIRDRKLAARIAHIAG
jgi:hypothetical protein